MSEHEISFSKNTFDVRKQINLLFGTTAQNTNNLKEIPSSENDVKSMEIFSIIL